MTQPPRARALLHTRFFFMQTAHLYSLFISKPLSDTRTWRGVAVPRNKSSRRIAIMGR
jgi:hypothetical protein